MKVILVKTFLIIFLFYSCSSSGSDDSSSNGSSDSLPFLFNACESIGAKIAGGESCAFLGSNTPIVRIRIQSLDDPLRGSICSGTLIDATTVLTAAHCLVGPVLNVEVDTNFGTIRASSFSTNPNFAFQGSSGFFVNDTALIFLSSEAGQSSFPLLLSRSISVGEEVVIAGFGQTSPSSNFGLLNAGNARVSRVTNEHITIDFIHGQSHPCLGDSGGPILARIAGTFAIAGVVSQSSPSVRTDEICKEGDITLYSNIQNPANLNYIFEKAPFTPVL